MWMLWEGQSCERASQEICTRCKQEYLSVSMWMLTLLRRTELWIWERICTIFEQESLPNEYIHIWTWPRRTELCTWQSMRRNLYEVKTRRILTLWGCVYKLDFTTSIIYESAGSGDPLICLRGPQRWAWRPRKLGLPTPLRSQSLPSALLYK